jgi:hypothetical protein
MQIYEKNSIGRLPEKAPTRKTYANDEVDTWIIPYFNDFRGG